MLGVRLSGVLLHPTSLPGPYGIGDLGPEARNFVDWLAKAGQTIWQVLPIGPPGFGESPYQLFSAFAGNPMLISPDALIERGWLQRRDLDPPAFPDEAVQFERVMPWKSALLRRAFDVFRKAPSNARAEFEAFEAENVSWLEDYARFMALKQAHGGAAWVQWKPGAVPNRTEIAYQKFLQWEFFREWRALREYCSSRGIRVVGDVPIYVAHDSADVWAHPEFFRVDPHGQPTDIAGVPPDYFSATGQLWGNPIYKWDRLADTGYRWWLDRMRAAMNAFDIVRLDHFRGFEAYWDVPAGDKTAERGEWVKGPGAALFRAFRKEFGGNLPFIAENLGVITPEVEAIRTELDLPGMAVLQFAFGNDPQAPTFQPHNYVRNLAAYTGTHDNDTVAGWWASEGGDSTRSAEEVITEKAKARAYLQTDGVEINWTLIRALMASVANLAVFPVQDVLGLGSESRMNTPSVGSGNWRWRMAGAALTTGMAARLAEMSDLYERGAQPDGPGDFCAHRELAPKF